MLQMAINSDTGQLTVREDYSLIVAEILVLILIVIIAILMARKENSN